MAKTQRRVTIDKDLAEKIEEILLERDLTLSELVQLYLRSTVNAHEQGKVLCMNDKFPFGKYKGEKVSLVAKLEPNYIRWLLGGTRPVQFDSEVLDFITEPA